MTIYLPTDMNKEENKRQKSTKVDQTSGHESGRQVMIASFGYKRNEPPAANVLFDVRFLQNPYWVDELRPLTGLDSTVQEYVLKQELAREFLSSLTNLLKKILPHLKDMDIDRYTIALGCTGGQHRSPALAEALASQLRLAFPDLEIVTIHRELKDIRGHELVR